MPLAISVSRITELLEGRDDLSALHIVSHGDSGRIQLGSSQLDAAALDAHASEIAGWSDALTLDADMLFYGCDLAADEHGKSFVESIASWTNACTRSGRTTRRTVASWPSGKSR